MRSSPEMIAAITLACAAYAADGIASHPSLTECLEGSDFIGNAALARDAGMTGPRFIERMQQDFMTIHAFPQQLRWFAHDEEDELFLTESARAVFEQPAPPELHRRAFLEACMERMADSAEAPAPADAPTSDSET